MPTVQAASATEVPDSGHAEVANSRHTNVANSRHADGTPLALGTTRCLPFNLSPLQSRQNP